MTFSATWLVAVQSSAASVSAQAIEELVVALTAVRERGGRVFVLGLGGSAANASHCVNDLRVRCGLEAYAPTDNVAELTARCNDEAKGWEEGLAEWLAGSRLSEQDAVVVLSGSGESKPLVAAARYACDRRADVIGLLGTARSTVGKYCRWVVVGGETAGQAETVQAMVWHCVAGHPGLALR